MRKVNTLLNSCIFLVLLVCAQSQWLFDCNHEELDFILDLIEGLEALLNGDRRLQLLSDGFLSDDPVFEPIRIMIDTDGLTNASSAIRNYLEDDLLPPALSLFESSLKVERLRKLRSSNQDGEICGDEVDDKYFDEGVDADLVIFVKAGALDSNVIAYARACSLESRSGRPVFGEIFFNTNIVSAEDADDMANDLSTTIHEITHVLGFSSSLYQYYNNDAEVRQTTINGQDQWYLDAEPLNEKVQEHFGCESFPGALLENQGGSGSAGSHFERRVFGNEVMTASILVDQRFSLFTLALLESTGWYEVDYDTQEPHWWGYQKGCDFIEEKCYADEQAQFEEEFCSNLLQGGCTLDRQYVGYCGTRSIRTDSDLEEEFDYFGNQTAVNDGFADNCPTVRAFSSRGCQDSNAANFAIIEGESYNSQSKCFTGDLSATETTNLERNGYCFTYECESNGGDSYTLTIEVGDEEITCSEEGQVSVDGYNGKLDCPDPDTFCSTVGQKFCKRGCMGRGSCQDGECNCDEGFTGSDCSIEEANIDDSENPNDSEDDGNGDDDDSSAWNLEQKYAFLASVILVFVVA